MTKKTGKTVPEWYAIMRPLKAAAIVSASAVVAVGALGFFDGPRGDSAQRVAGGKYCGSGCTQAANQQG